MNIAVLLPFLPSTVYTIQTHLFSCFHRVFVDMFENKSSVNLLILLFYICPQVHRGTPISYVLQSFHEHRIQVFFFFNFTSFYSLHRQLIRMVSAILNIRHRTSLARAQMGTTQAQLCFILGICARFGIIYFLNTFWILLIYAFT